MTSVREEYLRRVNKAVADGSEKGICSLITSLYVDNYMPHPEYISALNSIVDITEDFGFYSGCILCPINGMDVDECSIIAYGHASRSGQLWDKNTEYGKARIAIALALAEKL